MERMVNWENIFMNTLVQKNLTKDHAVCQTIQLGQKSCYTHVCPLWDGIFLWGNEMHTKHIDYPDHNLNYKNFVVINICHGGRCEVHLEDDIYIYMTPGMLNVNAGIPQSGYFFPGDFYEGLEIAFNLDILEKNSPPELTSFGLDMDYLKELLLSEKGNCMAMVTEAGLRKSKELYQKLKSHVLSLPESRFLTVSLLYHLKQGQADKVQNRTLVTKGQKRIANEVEQILTEDYKKHYTTAELAKKYGISPSALKKYFESVYGMPVSYYMKGKRMEFAKKLLAESGKHVGEIAEHCGYENQSKFGSAFKAYAGVSPLEYRRLNSGNSNI